MIISYAQTDCTSADRVDFGGKLLVKDSNCKCIDSRFEKQYYLASCLKHRLNIFNDSNNVFNNVK